MKTKKTFCSLAAAALLVSRAALAQQPPAPPPAEAAADEGKTRFQRGVQLFRENDFRSALVEFRRAYELTKNYKVLYNIGQTEYELQDYAGALRSFQRYLADGGAELEAARRTQVEEDIKKLGARVARIEIKSNAADAEVLVDDVVIGKTPLKDPVLVSIGRRKVTIQKGGLVSAARFVDLAGGDRIAVTVELAEPSAPKAPLGPTAPPPPAPAPSRTGMWVSLAVTGALVAGTAVTGVMALGAHSDAEKQLGTLGVKASDVEAAHTKTRNLALVADILGGAALAMAGVTIALGVTSSKSDAPPPQTATIRIGPRGAALGLSF
ncbi:MAG: PEGA domain-containing protein [Minicystis sp.]